jgi:hypothetical protein
MKKIVFVLIAASALSVGTAFAYDPQGSGKISNGNCTCKSNCDQFAKAGQLAGPQLAQCKSDCQQKYAGCNKGAQR